MTDSLDIAARRFSRLPDAADSATPDFDAIARDLISGWTDRRGPTPPDPVELAAGLRALYEAGVLRRAGSTVAGDAD